MDPSRLSQLYFTACYRMHQIIDDLYETIHSESGVPVGNKERVYDAVSEVKSELYHEIDLIKTAVEEHDESKS